MSKVFNEIKEHLTMRQVAEYLGYFVNCSNFIISPFSKEKTPSCKLYPHSFYDFSTNTGGDLVRFAALVLGVDNWRACQYLIRASSLPISLSGNADHKEEIKQRQRERQRQEERKQEFKASLLSEIGRLKRWADIYRTVAEKRLYPLFSDLWGYCISELQSVEYKLDILCAADQQTYRRMKPDATTGLSFDWSQWFWDVLAILAEDGTFQATQSELVEIKAQQTMGRR